MLSRSPHSSAMRADPRHAAPVHRASGPAACACPAAAPRRARGRRVPAGRVLGTRRSSSRSRPGAAARTAPPSPRGRRAGPVAARGCPGRARTGSPARCRSTCRRRGAREAAPGPPRDRSVHSRGALRSAASTSSRSRYTLSSVDACARLGVEPQRSARPAVRRRPRPPARSAWPRGDGRSRRGPAATGSAWALSVLVLQTAAAAARTSSTRTLTARSGGKPLTGSGSSADVSRFTFASLQPCAARAACRTRCRPARPRCTGSSRAPVRDVTRTTSPRRQAEAARRRRGASRGPVRARPSRRRAMVRDWLFRSCDVATARHEHQRVSPVGRLEVGRTTVHGQFVVPEVAQVARRELELARRSGETGVGRAPRTARPPGAREAARASVPSARAASGPGRISSSQGKNRLRPRRTARSRQNSYSSCTSGRWRAPARSA